MFLHGLIRGSIAGFVTVAGGLGAEVSSSSAPDSRVTLWVAGIGATATILVALITTLLPPLLRRKTVNDEQLALALVEKLTQAERHAHKQHEAIEALKAEIARKKAADA